MFDISEYDQLIALWNRCGLPCELEDRDSRERMEKQIYDDYVVILTFKDDDGKLIGAVIGSYDGRKGWINRLAIDPDYRGRRLATRLTEKAEEMLFEMGAKVIGALIEKENIPSMAAFKHCGYDCWSDIVYFRKKIQG